MENILVVEDDKVIRHGICSALGKRYTVEAFERGEEALNRLQERPYDLVLLDYKLPDTDGIHVAQKIKELHPEAFIIFMTAYGTMDLAIEALRLGVFDFIEKPFHHEVLMKAVDRSVSMKRLQIEGAKLQVRKIALEIGVPHELNEFAARISAWILVLERSLEPKEETAKLLEGFWKEMLGLLDVLKKIERFCGLECPAGTLSPTDVNRIIKEVVSFITEKWKLDAYSKGISYYVSTKLNDVRPVLVNPTDMRDVLTGLVISAFKAMPEGGSLLVESGMENDLVVIKVSDTGTRTPELLRARLTMPLQDFELGVTLAKHIIINYGGKVSMESTFQHGTVFTIRLSAERSA